MNNYSKQQSIKMVGLTFIPLAIALNIGIGTLVKALNLPLYLDSIGTILATLMLGWKRGAIVGIIGFIITSLFFNPFAIYFCGTQIAIAIFIHFMGKSKFFSNLLKTIFSGIGLGIIAAIVSAPVIIIVFQGATGNGSALITSFFLKMGNQIMNSVLLSGFSIEPIDKGIQCILAYMMLKGMPQNLLSYFRNGSLQENKFIH